MCRCTSSGPQVFYFWHANTLHFPTTALCHAVFFDIRHETRIGRHFSFDTPPPSYPPRFSPSFRRVFTGFAFPSVEPYNDTAPERFGPRDYAYADDTCSGRNACVGARVVARVTPSAGHTIWSSLPTPPSPPPIPSSGERPLNGFINTRTHIILYVIIIIIILHVLR